ncbi:MAG: pseudouridylate synthase [Planctomycetia bacterium]|nr:pseudouridylate synthase [Planctomycetia bacterium]
MLPRIIESNEEAIYASKPSGMFVHPTNEQRRSGETLLTWLRDRVGHYVYPVHRIDRASSGIVCMGNSSQSAALLQEAIGSQQAKKQYIVLARGETADAFTCDIALTRKKKEDPVPACTHFRKLLSHSGFSLLEATIETGRRHQIRRHLARLGHQVAGDSTYGKGKINEWLRNDFGLPRLFLHAYHLHHPKIKTLHGQSLIDPLPSDLLVFLRLFTGNPDLWPNGWIPDTEGTK